MEWLPHFFPPWSGNAGMAGQGCDVFVHETCYSGRFKHVTGVKREVRANWKDSEVRKLLLSAEDSSFIFVHQPESRSTDGKQ